MRIILTLAIILNVSIYTNCQKTPTDSIGYYLSKFKHICDKDSGSLWGINLNSNLAFFEKETRKVITNFPDKYSLLKYDKGIYSGILPDTIKVDELGKINWIFKWLPQNNEFTNLSIIIHENFHGFQDSLNLHPDGYLNKHIDSLNARIALRLEWYYLSQALTCDTIDAKENIKAAIFWRKYRHYLYPDFIIDEIRFEIHEGLAKYTEVVLACKEYNRNPINEAINCYKNRVTNVSSESTYNRSFGYCSGLMYGLLLDQYFCNWREKVKKESDLGKMLANSIKMEYATNLDSLSYYKRREIYEITSIDEIRREKEIAGKVNIIKKRFTQNPILIIEKTNNFKFSFNPNTIQMIDGGMFLPYFEATDIWGKMKVYKNGGIIGETTVQLPAQTIEIKNNWAESFENWTLQLNDDWKIIKKNNNFFVKKDNQY